MRIAPHKSRLINIYCDESSHLENDHQPVMGLGALSCPNNRVRDVAREIRDLKRDYGFPDRQELKWVGVAPSNIGLYKAVVELFFDSSDLRFRIVVADKRELDHAAFNQTHDDWYYKLFFTLLSKILEPQDCYEIYLDVKDTLGSRKVRKLHDVLCNAMRDFDARAVGRIELIRSHESALLQLADILIGSVCYVHREGVTSEAKHELVHLVKLRSGFSSLARATTPLTEQKFNMLYWTGAHS